MNYYVVNYKLHRDGDGGIEDGPQVEILKDENSTYNLNKNVLDLLHPRKYKKNKNEIWGSTLSPSKANTVNGAELTDFMTFTPYLMGAKFLLSNKIIEIINKMNVCRNELFPIEIISNGLKCNYNLFFTIPLSLKYIDFNQSKFFIKKGLTNINVDISTVDEFNIYEENYFLVDYELLSLFYKNFKGGDLFVLHDGKVIISERLFFAFKEENVTGVNFDMIPIQFT